MWLQTPLHETRVTRMKTFWRSCSTIYHQPLQYLQQQKCTWIQQWMWETSVSYNKQDMRHLCNRCFTTEVQQSRPVQGGKFDPLCQQQCGDGCVRGLDEEAVRRTEELRQTGRKYVYQTEFIRQVIGIHWVCIGHSLRNQHFETKF